MTFEIATVLTLLVIALVLFGTERIPIDVVTILLVIALVVTKTLPAADVDIAGAGTRHQRGPLPWVRRATDLTRNG